MPRSEIENTCAKGVLTCGGQAFPCPTILQLLPTLLKLEALLPKYPETSVRYLPLRFRVRHFTHGLSVAFHRIA